MKRYKRTNTKIVVLINLEYILQDVAAAEISHPANMRKSRRLDEIKLTILNDIVDSALSVIRSAGFEITKKYQSKRSYTYYIWFQPLSDSGEQMMEVEVEFRISGDHQPNTMQDNEQYQKVIVKSIIIGPEEYDNPADVLNAIEDICTELKKGNTAVLFKYTFSG